MAGPDKHSDMTAAARVRTDFAEDRTVLSNERTFASWLRTGFGAIAIGLGFTLALIAAIWLLNLV